MIDAIIRGSLGNFGTALLDFYLENALWINLILIVYALIVLFGKQGNIRIKKAIRESLISTYGDDVQKKNLNWFTKTMGKSPLDWQPIAAATWIPVFSIDKSLWFRRKTVDNLKEVYTPERIKHLFDYDAELDSGENIQP